MLFDGEYFEGNTRPVMTIPPPLPDTLCRNGKYQPFLKFLGWAYGVTVRWGSNTASLQNDVELLLDRETLASTHWI